MVPFYGWGSTALRLVPLQGGGLLFTTKFPFNIVVFCLVPCFTRPLSQFIPLNKKQE